jgi:acetyl-CoA acetyltransferase
LYHSASFAHLSADSACMSIAPLQAFGHVAWLSVLLGQGLMLSDSLWDGLTNAHANTPMGMTAANLADDYGIT